MRYTQQVDQWTWWVQVALFSNSKGSISTLLMKVVALLLFVGIASGDSKLPAGRINDTEVCPKQCICIKATTQIKVDCSNLNLTSVPSAINPKVASLDLSDNKISQLSDFAFSHLPQLEELNLGSNSLMQLSPNVFNGLHKLKVLSLQDNKLEHVPEEALRFLPTLETLNLAANKIQIVPEFAFMNQTKLLILVLQKNSIEVIQNRAFTGLNSLRVLEINSNKLQTLPEALSSLPMLQDLTFADNQISYVPDNAFQNNPQLTLLEMGGNPIVDVGRHAFSYLPDLKELYLREVHNLKLFPDLSGTTALEHLLLNRGLLQDVPSGFCTQTPHLRSLDLKSNRLSKLPELRNCTKLRLLDLSYNHIQSLEDSPFRSQTKLIDLFLGNNFVERIYNSSFLGLKDLQVMDLKNNRITFIDIHAFAQVPQLRDLNLGNNLFSTLPTQGLQNLRQLKTFNNPKLKEFPPPEFFPQVHTLALSYAYHCCAFLPVTQKPTPKPSSLQETIVWLSKDDVDISFWKTNLTDVWPNYGNFSSNFEEFENLWKTGGRDYSIPDDVVQDAEEYFEDYKSVYNSEEALLSRYPIKCIPQPDPFMPCEDLFGWWTLRCGVWIVFLLAMLGNGVVVIVLLFGHSKMDVPRFLVCNLAVADFFMGIYLEILAVVDASTLGEFRVFAIAWQTSAGCQVAGFLGVLSSELSVYTLSVITLERNYAITHAMHLNKRLSLKHAGYVMICGWMFALIMALMPLFGVSDYRKFAVCLPFETEPTVSLCYVVFLILVNGVAFLILMGCYLKMYCAIRGSHAWNSNDSRIAKRMALLVFTDFICWAPIAFFSLSAVSGLNLISLEEAKVFTIFVLPFNSCANPFLYAIFTKQFKKDCVLICKRIEESRVTRGIGRCRHSSNFSNRQTPANTNSAIERKSGGSDLPPCHCGSLKVTDGATLLGRRRRWKRVAMRYLTCQDQPEESENNDYTYAIAQIQKNLERGTKRATSISSENFSSRSDSWRQGNIPLRLLERSGRPNLNRKFSQDSNMSCSRQDSSTSTFRISRSSVSSDSSNHRPGLLNFRDRQGPIESGQLGRHLGGVREKMYIDGESMSCLMRDVVSISRDKPRLCRQVAVDDTYNQKQIVRGSDTRLLQKSPPFLPLRQGVLCPNCSRKNRSPPLYFKSKEMEEKFNCFYNRLAENSHEDSSDISTYKDEHVIVSSDHSTGDHKVDSSNTNDTSIPDSSTQEDQDKDASFRPHITIKKHSAHDYVGDNETNVCKWLHENANENLQQSKATIRGSTDSVHNPSHLHVNADNVSNSKSKSMTSIGWVNKLTPSRKVASDNSLKKHSLKSLPALLRSLSSQSTRKFEKLKVRSQCHLKAGPAKNLPCSRSEIIIHQHSPDYSPEWSPSFPRLLREADEGRNSESDLDDICINLDSKSYEKPNTQANAAESLESSKQETDMLDKNHSETAIAKEREPLTDKEGSRQE
ncbi:uncharacterized protein LOC143228914 isoform X2 [Tachypleus tridentatus]|uniref:uncharacterized protein LOC143228914 isoform X2 n=1 Tax=Tachypleus tridentatus TaxID=6853 RepID=UPI003FD4743A